MNDDEEELPRRPVSPAVIVITLGVIASMLYPVLQVFLTTQSSRLLVAKAFSFVLVVMGALALFQIARALTRPPKR